MTTLFQPSIQTAPCLIDGEAVRILIVDDERAIREFCKVILDPLEVIAVDCSSVTEARQILETEDFDIVLTDIQMPEENGIDLLNYSREKDPSRVVIIITGHGTIENAVEAMKNGAFDYIQKPLSPDAVRAAIRKAAAQRELALENVRLRRLLREKYSFSNIVGKSRGMEHVFRMIQKVAPSDSTVLIVGESGTGKELIARAVHIQSRREARAFVKVNCSALPEHLLETELFGYLRGAFSGAVTDKRGLLREANRGSIFLDEIGGTSLSVQGKLLRLIQEGIYRPIGSTEDEQADVRIVASTNRDLREEVRAGRFREDLFYRLNVITIAPPPLRKRKDDIPLLVQHFLRRHTQPGSVVPSLSSEARKLLTEYSWPGNVRELENVIERACLLCNGEEIVKADLPEELVHQEQDDFDIPSDCGRRSMMSLEEGEKRQISYIFKALRGHRGKTAEVLQVSRRSLYDKLKRYEIAK